jgi:HEAT repeat protein
LNDEQQKRFEQLVSMLDNPDPETRSMVATGLGHIKDVQAVNPLVALLSDNDERVRIAAVRSLGEIGNFTAVEPLLPLLREENPPVRVAVILALAQMPDSRAFASIVVALFDVDDEVRRNAAAAISQLGDPRALQPLIECLNDPYYWVRANAAWSLGKLGFVDAVQPLIELLAAEKDEVVRANALTALGALDTSGSLARVLAALADETEAEKARIAAMLAIANHYALDEADPEAFNEQQLEQARALVLTLLLGAPEDELRATAAWSLGRLPEDEASNSALVAALGDEYHWVHDYAAESLALLEVPAQQKTIDTQPDTK